MKIRPILFAVLLGAVALTSAQTFNPARKFVVDAKDAYTMKMQMTSSMGDITVNMDTTQTVKKVYDNGDADIETAVSNMTVAFGGNEMRPPAQPGQTMRVNKFGMPVTPTTSRSNSNFARFGSYFGDKELKVGDTHTFDEVDKSNAKVHVKGTVKLLSIDAGKAKFSVTVDNYMATSDKPMHLDGTAIADAATGTMLRFDGKATDLPGMGGGGQGPAVSSAEFTIVHK